MTSENINTASGAPKEEAGLGHTTKPYIVKEITVGRSETIPVKQFHTVKLYHQLTVEVTENENTKDIVNTLHNDAKRMLDEQKEEQGLVGNSTKVETSTDLKVDETEQEKSKEPSTPEKDTIGPVNSNEDDNKKQESFLERRNRKLSELIEEYNIKSPKHAGYLRWQGLISYKEWKRLHEYLSAQEICELSQQN
jgi:hypothetical protein